MTMVIQLAMNSIASLPARLQRARLIAMLAIAALSLAGCSQPAPSPARPTPQVRAEDHDHPPGADHGHDHDHAHTAGDHEHGAGPHGGTLADWGGGKYHVEFTVDHDANEAVVYVLGGDQKTPAPVHTSEGKLLLTIREPSFQVELVARPLAGEAGGTASCYGGGHESLGIVREFAGTISGAIDGTPFAGDFEEHAHEHD